MESLQKNYKKGQAHNFKTGKMAFILISLPRYQEVILWNVFLHFCICAVTAEN